VFASYTWTWESMIAIGKLLRQRVRYAGTAPPIVVRCIKRRWGMS
jgi:hypothetical protein